MNEDHSRALDGLQAGLTLALAEIEMRRYFQGRLEESVRPRPAPGESVSNPIEAIKPDLYRKLLGNDTDG